MGFGHSVLLHLGEGLAFWLKPTAPATAFFYQLLDLCKKGHVKLAAIFQGLLPAELPSSHPLLWPHGVDAERLLDGSVHGKEVADDLLSAGGSS